jgi:hypothetical protein
MHETAPKATAEILRELRKTISKLLVSEYAEYAMRA